jgi:16S rRNA (cytosine967-C5)-methyltransferase
LAERVAPARRAAFRALDAIRSRPIDLGEALRRFRDPLPDGRDRALATDLVTGTLRWRGKIDFQIQRVSAKPLARLDDGVLDALRLGAYQLLYLTRIPASAVVGDAVELVRVAGFRSAAGFTNAVLRKIAAARMAPVWPERPAGLGTPEARSALVAYLAVMHSHPEWLVERWVSRYGVVGAEAWLEFNNQKPAVTLATNRLRIDRGALARRLLADGIETTPTRVAPFGLTVTRGRAAQSASFRDGLCLVQDEASQLVPELVQASPRARVLDACASPGGKTLALAAQALEGLVVATDVRGRRIEILAETIRRTAAGNVRIVRVGEDGALPFANAIFDRVLVDAPCSGLGTVRRDPDIKWRRTPDDLRTFAAKQIRLLRRVSPLVARGGRLIYSTCSSEPEENEDVVAAFLDEAADFGHVPLTRLASLAGNIADMSTADGYLRTTPHDGLEAFFGAVVERRL